MNKDNRRGSKKPLEYYEKAILQLTETQEELQEELKSIRAMKVSHEDLKAQLQEAREGIETLKEKLKDSQNQKEALEKAESKIISNENNINFLYKEIQEFKKEIDGVKNDLSKVEREVGETRKTADQSLNIVSEMPNIIMLTSRATGMKYHDLDDLLKFQKWEEADLETRATMLEICGQESNEAFYKDVIHDFYKLPCEDLQIINRLWHQASDGHFSWSVQKRIWYDCGRNWNRWGDQTGWRRNGSWMSDHKKLTFSLDAPKGHLPVVTGTLENFFNRLNSCDI